MEFGNVKSDVGLVFTCEMQKGIGDTVYDIFVQCDIISPRYEIFEILGMSETSRSEQLVTSRVSSPEDSDSRWEREWGSRNEADRTDEEVSDKPLSEICLKRKRSDGEDDDKDGNVRRESDDDEEEDGFKTPTRPVNRVPEICECPAAPRKQRPELSDFAVSKWGSCRRDPDFLPEDIIDSFFTDLQRPTTTMKKKKMMTTEK
ncbi:PREDICTED: uncharacterized protein LOC104807014 [Tarenaya hassleriana]|uniref:uncharacterized protein LOC104807014 n=1 Tax=Tarenaya hassleriana TaxID=28532 RepID=UPI00053CA8D0|nr:PREDICTED: uncharacterized protein LOC104807014 [Tarenaya hassleriana]